MVLRPVAGERSGVQVALDDRDGTAAEEGAVAAQPGADEAGAGAALEAGQLVAAEPGRPVGASAVWALPVTGSSSMPTAGKKPRETKS